MRSYGRFSLGKWQSRQWLGISKRKAGVSFCDYSHDSPDTFNLLLKLFPLCIFLSLFTFPVLSFQKEPPPFCIIHHYLFQLFQLFSSSLQLHWFSLCLSWPLLCHAVCWWGALNKRVLNDLLSYWLWLLIYTSACLYVLCLMFFFCCFMSHFC